MEKSNKGSNGLGFGTILFLIFLTLKLGGWGTVANWSWWWVFSPIWISFALVIIAAVIIGLIEILKK
jgi:hypothetical protein